MQRLKNRNNNMQGMRRVIYIDEDSDKDVSDDNEEKLVLQIDGKGHFHLFYGSHHVFKLF